jgi:hypothetical protein
VSVLVPTSVHAQESAEARAVLDKAIKALGGKDSLTRFQAATWKSKGTFDVNEMKIAITDEWSVQSPDRYRWQLDATVMERTITLALVLNKDKAWVKGNNENTNELPAEIRDLFRTDFQVVRLAQQLVPLSDKAHHLSHLGELKIDDRPAVGIKVARKGAPDIDLFFDKDTSLPLRSEIRLKEPMGAEEAVHTFYFSSYKEVSGVKAFTKIVMKRNDKPFLELELNDIQLHEKLEDNVFDKP